MGQGSIDHRAGAGRSDQEGATGPGDGRLPRVQPGRDRALPGPPDARARPPGRLHAWWAPASWTSSTMICSTPRQCSAQPSWLSKSDRLSGVVIKMRRPVTLLAPEVGRGIPRRTPTRTGLSSHLEPPLDALQRNRQVALDVVAQAPQRGDVDAPKRRSERSVGVRWKSRSRDRQEPGQGLAGPRRRDQKHVLARRDRWPGPDLRRESAPRERPGEPIANRTRERRQRVPGFDVDRVHPGGDGASWPHRLPLDRNHLDIGLKVSPLADSRYGTRCAQRRN